MEPLNRASQIKTLTADDPRAARVLLEIERYRRSPDALIQVLHVAQDVFGYLSLDVLQFVGRELKLPPSHVYGVATFYHLFSLKPKAEHRVVVCTGTACQVRGAEKILEALRRGRGLTKGSPAAGGRLSLDHAHCIGACGLAPAVLIDERMQARADAGSIDGLVTAVTGVPR